jgi:Tfp pilus assembly protein PilX
MTRTPFLLLPLLCWLGVAPVAHAASPTSPASRGNDFPTVDRVLYVQECVAAHPDASNFEMVNKCSCALDALAQEIKYQDYVELSTASKATTIAGERGSVIRDSEKLQAGIKRYRALQTKVNKGCFIGPADGR